MPELAVVNCAGNRALLVSGERIAAYSTRAEVERLIGSDCEVIDAGGRLLMPGFVDAHTHLVFAGNRAGELDMKAAGMSYQEIAKAGGGIRSTVARTRAASEDELLEQSVLHAQWMLRCGTTTAEVKSGYGLTVEDELKMLRVARRVGERTGLRCVTTFLGAHIVPDEYRDNRTGYVDLIVNEMLPRVSGLAEYCDVFCETSAFTLAEAGRILTAAREHGLRLRLHADQLSAGAGAQLAAGLGASTADHLEHTDAAGIAALKSANVQPVLLPGSVYALGSHRYPAARDMLAAGLEVVLATDFNPGSSPTPSMTMVLSLAVTQMKMTPAEALRAATVSAARSLARENEVGTLAPGKLADFVLHDCEDSRELAYWFGMETAAATYVGGRCVYTRISGS